jgi:outer membrane lipoprotein carrier protein
MFFKTFFILMMLFGQEGQEASSAPDPVIAEPTAPELAVAEPLILEPATVTLEMPESPNLGTGSADLHIGGISVAPALLEVPFLATKNVAGAITADTVVGKVQSFYKKTKQLTAKFRQTYSNKTFGRNTVSDGMVWIKKPGKMRWDYKGKKLKVEKSFISDGKMLWAIEHNNRQYFKKSLEQNLLPVAVTFLYGKGDLRRDFSAALDSSGTYGKSTDHVIKLTPRKPSAQYKLLYLVVDPANYRVKQSIVIEASGNINHFRFYEPNTNKTVQDSYFYFNEKKFKGKYRLANPEKKTK